MTTEHNHWTTAPDYHDAKCDFCGEKAAYDAATKYGPWAFVCEAHFATETNGTLGLGKGQRLVAMQEVRS